MNGAEGAPAEGGGDGKKPVGRPRHELPGIGDNSFAELEGIVVEALASVKASIADRQAINADIQGVRETLFGKGIPKEAFDLARAYMEWPEDKRRNFDLAYAICRKAMGAPIQRDLFEKFE